jgi:RNA polymerase sigma-70 factor (ECF subfamily)
VSTASTVGLGHHRPDQVTIGRAFAQYAALVGSIGVKTMGLRGDLDDYVQGVFLIALSRLETLRQPESFKAWLMAIALNHARVNLRRRRVRKFFPLEVAFRRGAVADPGPSPEDRVAAMRMRLVLESIPPDERQAWVARHIEGAKLEEVAELCNCSLATAKRRIAAARSKLECRLGR